MHEDELHDRTIARRRARHTHAQVRGGLTAHRAIGNHEFTRAVECLSAAGRLGLDHPRVQWVTGGVELAIEEVAQALDLSPNTVKRDWTFARAWLCREVMAST